jgi:transglutaminase-like putative cysteine protease
LQNPPGIERYIRQLWRIVPDPPDAEYIRAPELQLKEGAINGFFQGDCDDSAVLAAALLAAGDWPAVLTAIRMPNESEYSHVWARSVFNSVYIDIDPIVPAEKLPITNFAQALHVVL